MPSRLITSSSRDSRTVLKGLLGSLESTSLRLVISHSTRASTFIQVTPSARLGRAITLCTLFLTKFPVLLLTPHLVTNRQRLLTPFIRCIRHPLTPDSLTLVS